MCVCACVRACVRVCMAAGDSTFCIVDSESTCCSVTVYNIVQGWGVKIGDSVAIPEPFLQRVDFQRQDQVYAVICLLTAEVFLMYQHSSKLLFVGS